MPRRPAPTVFYQSNIPFMTDNEKPKIGLVPTGLFLPADATIPARPIWLVSESEPVDQIGGLTPAQRAWLAAVGFTGTAKKHATLPAGDGTLAGVVLGIGDGASGEPSGPFTLLLGQLASTLPTGVYSLATPVPDADLAAVAWGLGAYRFRRYKSEAPTELAALKLPPGADSATVTAIVEGIWLGRDLINTPASDLGPAELQAAARALAERHGANVTAIVGDELLTHNFPMIHAVGRASTRAPRLIDLSWGSKGAPKVTLVGKGVCFDTGGLDIKTSSSMLLMKKDMGGAATALALGHMTMALKLDVRLRILIPAVENAISGNAFRPGDVLRSRAGKTVEIGNTDAEGRIVLADALALADEEAPDTLLSFATLTGAARVALGPDLPPFYTDDDAFAAEIAAAGIRIGDPLWRMPFWSGYERNLDSEVADMNNVYDAPFAGSVMAALFLRRFVRNARRFAHFDIYGWRPAARPLGPKGGEPQAARAMLEVLSGPRRR
jgi:leucyl aminopeptidase